MIRVTYLSHSGFLVELADAYFLFDFYKGELPDIDTGKKFFVFVSHAHHDHYQKEIFHLRDRILNLQYILSNDISIGKAADILFVGPRDKVTIKGCEIETLRSTDEGVAFLLHYGQHTVYFAGDLNWWHWEGESEAYNTMMRRNYQHEINKLQQEQIDLAFVPVDPRLGEQYCWGLDCFMKRTSTKYVFPMHFWDNYQIFDRLALEGCAADYEDKIVRIEREGQSFELEI